MKAYKMILALGLTMPAWFFQDAKAQQGGPVAASPYPIIQGKTYKFEKIADGIYYATGGGGSNNPVIVNDEDVLIVDDGSTPAAARALADDIKLITAKPVRYVVNTHFHYDHTDGNSVFAPSADIIAHEYVRTAILNFDVLNREPYKTSQGTRVAGLIDSLKKQIAGESDAARKETLEKQLATAQANLEQLREIKPTPPNVTYASKMVLYKGRREIQLLFLGRGHTGGDTVVFLPNERIVCTGDLMETGVAYMGDAFFDEWITTLDALKKLDFAVLLPGHGTPFGDKGHITAFQSYLKDVMSQVADLRKQGLSAEDAAQRVDLTSHQKDFPQIQRPGADLRGVRHLYEWMGARGNQ
jgi:cyclase